MPNVSARPDIGAEDPSATRLDREDAHALWSALLPTWTDPSAARVRNLGRLVRALRNPRAVATIADSLERRARERRLRGVKP